MVEGDKARGRGGVGVGASVRRSPGHRIVGVVGPQVGKAHRQQARVGLFKQSQLCLGLVAMHGGGNWPQVGGSNAGQGLGRRQVKLQGHGVAGRTQAGLKS